MKGFVGGVLAVLILLWVLGPVDISCSPLSVNDGSGGGVSDMAQAPLDGSSEEPAVDDLVSFQGEGFSISLPGTPERMTKSDGGNKYVFYNVKKGDLSMGIGYTRVPRAGRPVDLSAQIKASAVLYGGIVHDEARTSYQGFPARDATYSGVDGCCTLFIRVIDTGTRFFQLEYHIQGSDRATPAVFKRFLSSLRLN